MIANLVGQQFGRLLVIEFAGMRQEYTRRRPLWKCLCACGKEKTILGRSLISGVTKSCGCSQRRARSHGACTAGISSTYGIWCGIKQRCQNPKNKAYKFYGGQGVTLCERWQKFENFLADMGERPADLTIERKENSRGYEPSNCIWAPMEVQMLNRRKPSHTKLTGAQAQCVRMLGPTNTAPVIAKIYQTTPKVVYDILSQRTWKDLPIYHGPGEQPPAPPGP